ncbi:MAG: matrixin family metalloprotease [Planctomycetes bacterium]|nr:matrixin family metalloprotease [Planctomycetota bacterium]
MLAFAFFPDAGDITFDIDEPWNDATNNFRFFISTLGHEAGHTFGMEHVGPPNGTKLMEPFDHENLREPLDDDIRGVNANYGDTMESNDTSGSAADLGAYSPGADFAGLALVGGDEDWFSFSAGSGQLVAASVRPVGGTYLIGPDGGPFGNINTQAIVPLGIEIYDQSGVELLRVTVNTVAGGVASSVPVAVPDGNSQFLVRVFTEGGGDVQRYELKLPSAVSEPAILSIESVGADGIDVSASPADGVGVSMLTSPGQLIYARGQSVTLSVPSSAEGVQFIQWLIGGDAQTPGQTQATFSVSGDTTITAIFADAPTINAGPAKTIVVGESVQLEGSATGGSPPYTFSWEPSAGVIDADTATPTVSPAKSTDYSMTVVDSNGTTVIDTVRVEVLPTLRADAGANQFTINGGSFALTGSATGAVEPYSFAWTPATLLSEPNQSLTRGSLSETTDFTLTVTDADGRKAASVVKVVVVGSIVVNVGEDVQIRPGQSMRLTAKITGGLPPYSVQWTPAFLATTVTTRSVLVKPQEDTTFGVLVTDALGQEGRDTVAVSLAAPLSVTASARPGSVLLGESTTLVGAVSGGVPPFEYTWGPDGDVADLHAQQSELTPSVTRTYGLNVRDSLGQTGAASVRVVVVRPEQALNTQSALQAPEVSATPTLLPTCGAGLLGVLPLMAASMIPFRRRRLRRA